MLNFIISASRFTTSVYAINHPRVSVEHVMVNPFYIFETLGRISSDFCYVNGSCSFYCLEFFSSSRLGNYPKDNLATKQNTGCSSDVCLKYTQKEIDILAVFGYDA
jgi:hypothetical protein